jgi:D-beta-D-heptose 7-phosphate kinase/D-beta-D-heptose 1-phosphate adenosyltransferase
MQENLNFIAEQHLTQVPKSWKILLLGDSCTDKYVYGIIDRLSPEAPVPVFVPQREETRQGMAGNVEENLKRLGCTVSLVTLPGSTKTRFIDQRSNQHIMRLDQDVNSIPIVLETSIPPIYDAVVISDYNKGCISYELVEEILRQFKGPVFIDTKKTDLKRFEGAFVKINSLENSLAKTLPSQTLVTLGKQGCEYAGQIYLAPQVEVADVCGAGDTFLAALVYEFLRTNQMPAAIKFANRAAAITVKHMGVYAPKLEEINAS